MIERCEVRRWMPERCRLKPPPPALGSPEISPALYGREAYNRAGPHYAIFHDGTVTCRERSRGVRLIRPARRRSTSAFHTTVATSMVFGTGSK